MDYVEGYNGIDCGDSCNPDDGDWPDVPILIGLDKRTSKRSSYNNDNRLLGGEDGDSEIEDDEFDDGNEDSLYSLDARDLTTATISPKNYKVCGRKLKTSGSTRYPAFKQNPKSDWKTLDNGRWAGVSAYWGNSSAECWNWGVAKRDPYDTDNIGLTRVRSKYNGSYPSFLILPSHSCSIIIVTESVILVEHVFEAQLIGDFFTQWLDEGKIKRQKPETKNPQTKFSCESTLDYVLGDTIWGGETFVQYLMHEIGSIEHLDRLTVYKARPNGMKGAVRQCSHGYIK
jgi:chitinase